MNLTSITEYEDVVWKHFLDSALIMKDSLWNEKIKYLMLEPVLVFRE